MTDFSENQAVLLDPIEDTEEQIDGALGIYNETLSQYRAGVAGITQAHVDQATETVKALKARLGSLIATGASACPSCESPVFGMRQPTGFEIGCPNCRDHRARGNTRRVAVANWNRGPTDWAPAKKFEADSALGKLCKKLKLDPEALPKFVARDPKGRVLT
jgi:hypothetical protein